MADQDEDTIIRQIYAELRHISERLDRMSGEFLPRVEYEKRRAEAVDHLQSQINDLKTDLDTFKRETGEKQRATIGNQIAIWVAIGEGIIAILLHFWR
jgi:hypothetical protein